MSGMVHADVLEIYSSLDQQTLANNIQIQYALQAARQPSQQSLHADVAETNSPFGHHFAANIIQRQLAPQVTTQPSNISLHGSYNHNLRIGSGGDFQIELFRPFSSHITSSDVISGALPKINMQAETMSSQCVQEMRLDEATNSNMLTAQQQPQRQLYRHLERHHKKIVASEAQALHGNVETPIRMNKAKEFPKIVATGKSLTGTWSSFDVGERVPKYFDDPIQEIFLEEIIEDVYYMTKEQYANNVVQHILQHGKALVRSLIIKRFIGKVVTMSKQKYASNVFEKCLVFSSYDETQKIINEVLTIAKGLRRAAALHGFIGQPDAGRRAAAAAELKSTSHLASSIRWPNISCCTMSSAASTARSSQSTSRKDPAWEFALPLTGNETKNQVGCLYCKNYFKGGITRLKRHLAGVRGQSVYCTQVPDDVKEKVKAMLDAHGEKKSAKLDSQLRLRQQVNINGNDDEEMEEVGEVEVQEAPSAAGSTLVRKKPRNKGPLDSYCMRPEEPRAKGKHIQTTMSKHYRRGRSLMNLVAHCARGMCFIDAIDASLEVHDGKYIYSLVSSCIDEIGPKKVVQVVTDNASNNMSASKMLQVKHPHIFWTSCAAHYIDLMLEDIGKITMVHNIIRDGKSITNLLYAQVRLLAIMRQFTKGDLVRAGTTRFATSYLNLKSLYDKRNELKQLFASQDWAKSSWAKKIKGQNAHNLVMNNKFWSQMLEVINYFEPLAYVLRRVDGDVPAMGYIYGDLIKAKKDVAACLNGNEKKYSHIWKIIDARWDSKLKTTLHKAGYFLNPCFFYENKREIKEDFLMQAVVECATCMYRDDITVQDICVAQLSLYTEAMDSFGTTMAIRQRNSPTITPDDDPPNEWIIDDDAPAQQPEVDAQSAAVSRKRRLIHKKSSSKAKKACVVVEEEEEEFQSSNSEHEEEENIPYADGSSDHELDDCQYLIKSGETEALMVMVNDQYANYVVQKVIETCDECLRMRHRQLRNCTYAKHVVARIERLIEAGERIMMMQPRHSSRHGKELRYPKDLEMS
uniref:BED-type domain-containing protein n=1 Tax=Oryza sativa subsp. japonica TaxID=39947 RepID=Q5W690_ORYSJ|nr:unknown protein [Oryza sativa Japonica Group]